MAVLIVFIVYLTITGHISGQENGGKGLQSVLTNLVDADIQKPADIDEGENLLEMKGLDESIKLSEEKEEESPDALSSKIETHPKTDGLQNGGKINKTVADNSKTDLGILSNLKIADVPKESKLIEANKEGLNGEVQKKEAVVFKPLSVNKTSTGQWTNEVQKVHSNNQRAKHHSKKTVVHKKKHDVMPGKHPLTKEKIPPKAAAKSADRNNHILSNGGKLVQAKLPESLIMKQVPKLFGHFKRSEPVKVHAKTDRRKMKTSENKMKKGGVHVKKGGVHVKNGRVHVKKGGVHVKKGGVHVKKGGVHMKKGGVHVKKGGVQTKKRVIESKKSGKHMTKGVHKMKKKAAQKHYNEADLQKAWKIVKGL